MERIISIVENENEKLQKEVESMSNIYEKLNRVLSGIKVNVVDIDSLDRKETVSTLTRTYLAMKLDKEYNQDFFDKTKFIDTILNTRNMYDVVDIIDSLDKVLEETSVSELLDLFKSNKILLDFSNNSKKISNVISLSAKIIELRTLVAASKFPMIEMLQYMKDNGDSQDVCEVVCYGACIDMESDPTYDDIERDVPGKRIYIGLCTTLIAENAREFDRKVKNNLTSLRKKVNAYDEIIKYLNKNKDKKEITNIPSSYKKLSDETKLELVKAIYEHNMVYNNELEKQYLKSSQSQVKKREQLLSKYKIKSKDLFYEYDYDELENILRLLSDMDIIKEQDIENLIKNVDTNKLEYIFSQYELGFLNKDFISNHKSIFGTDDSDDYKNLIFNIRKLKKMKVSKETIEKQNDILLTDSKIISNNFGIIDTYMYTDSLKDAEDISFIKEKDLALRFDILLELGLETDLDKDISLLGYDVSRYKRLELCRRLNLLTDDTNIKAILNSDRFMIKDDDLDSYILSLSGYNNGNNIINKDEFLSKLSEYQDSNRVYNIDGLLVSKFKVEREMSRKDSLTESDIFNTLSKNKKLDTDSYMKLSDFIKGKTKSNQKIKVDGKNC